jgi:hypothetical protein
MLSFLDPHILFFIETYPGGHESKDREQYQEQQPLRGTEDTYGRSHQECRRCTTAGEEPMSVTDMTQQGG